MTVTENDLLEEKPENEPSDQDENNPGDPKTSEPSNTPSPKDDEDEIKDEIQVTFGDEEPAKDDNTVIRNFRKTQKELSSKLKRKDDEIADLKKKLSSVVKPEEPFQLGKKPRMEDFEYDAEVFEVELEKWYEAREKIEQNNRSIRQREEIEKEKATKIVQKFLDEKQTLLEKVQDYEVAEVVVTNTLSQVQLAAIVEAANSPATLIYALGKNPKKLKEMAEIENPAKFVYELAKMEGQMKVTSLSKSPIAPEKTIEVHGSSVPVGDVDKKLESLLSKARSTGNYDEYLKAKRQLNRS